MKQVFRNILALISGIVTGSIINMGLVTLGGSVIPPPPGSDLETMEGLKAAMSIMEPKHFLFPFLAHALGTLTGAYVAARIGAGRKMILAMAVGCFFLVGGVYMVMSLPSPLWFNVLDLAGAYLPMAFVGAKLAGAK